MGRGVSSGGGQSSLGYLFGSGEAPKPNNNKVEAPQNLGQVANNEPAVRKPASDAAPANINKETPAGVPAAPTNNYFRAEGQNCGNFITVMFSILSSF